MRTLKIVVTFCNIVFFLLCACFFITMIAGVLAIKSSSGGWIIAMICSMIGAAFVGKLEELLADGKTDLEIAEIDISEYLKDKIPGWNPGIVRLI